ncbi:hypothetical protein ACFRAE_16645 [Sphingobacterium sp. HJSM2_6]|uniref:hypothetical protein n=1 Tax=Sphingobacterium sp. HJSM2_6 TaxID=3366264 RepID=UPI003BC1F720
MVKKIIFILTAIVCVISLTSCFDFVEEIDFKSNGSGKIKGTMNLSKSKTKLASLMKLDKIDGFKIPKEAEIRQEMADVVRILKQTKGISNVNHQLDFQNFIAFISCDFENAQALNAFNNALSVHFKTKLSNYSNYAYDRKNKVFKRDFKLATDAKTEFAKLSAEHQKSFDQAFFTSIYRFDTNIKSKSNTNSKIASNQKAIMLKTNLPSLINSKTTLGNQIQLN